MKKIFKGKKRFITIPIAIIVGLFLLPLTILFFITWLVNSKISNKIVKNTSFSIIGILALLFSSAYAVGITNPSTQKPDNKEQTTTTVKTATEENKITLTPTLAPTKILTPTITPKPTKKPTPTLKPTKIPTSTIRLTSTPIPTIRPTAIPVIKISTPIPTQTQQPSQGFICNCSKACTEISSCAEAQFQLNTCGCKQRDNDNDGIACDKAPLLCEN